MKKIKNCYPLKILNWIIKPTYLHLIWAVPSLLFFAALAVLEELGVAFIFSGSILQISGIVLAIIGLFGIRKYFEKAGLLDLFKSWVSEFPKYKQSTVVQAATAEMKSDTGKVVAHGTSTTRGNNNLLVRVNQLEERLNQESLRVSNLNADIERQQKELKKLIQENKHLLEKQNKNLDKKIEESSTRGIWDEIVGLTWILIGLIFTTIGSEM